MDLPSWVDTEAWEGFVSMRKSLKKPLTERAKKLAIRKLEQLLKQGYDPTAVLDQSTFNSWQGLFPIKNDGGRIEKTKSFAEQRHASMEAQHRRFAERISGISERSGNMATVIPEPESERFREKSMDSSIISIPKVEN